MKVLVTGGAGMIGSHVVDRLVSRGDDVVVFDNLDPRVHPGGTKPAYLNSGALFIQGDIRDEIALRPALEGVEAVVHLAAIVGGLQSQYRNHEYVDVGIGGTALLLDLLIHDFPAVRRLVVASSAALYGEGKYQCLRCGVVHPPDRSGPSFQGGFDPPCPHCGGEAKPLPTDEATPPYPQSTYAIVKKGQEDLTLNFARNFSRHAAALRFFSVYGPRQSLANPYSGVLSIFANRVLNGLRPVVYEDGRQMRDFVSVHDAVSAVLAVLERPEASGRAYNIAGGEPKGIGEVASAIARALGTTAEPELQPMVRRGDVRHCVADISAAARRLGFAPRISFAQGVDILCAWARENFVSDVFDSGAQELARYGIA
jgi:dTDP-L-rhamnose 4-epimerase